MLQSVSYNAERTAVGVAPDDVALELTEEFEFTFVVDEQVLARFFAEPGEYLVGREAPSKIVIDIDGIAPQHAQLILGPEAWVENLHEEASVFVDGQQLAGRTVLLMQQAITFGNGVGELRFEKHTPGPEKLETADDELAVFASELAEEEVAEVPIVEQPPVEIFDAQGAGYPVPQPFAGVSWEQPPTEADNASVAVQPPTDAADLAVQPPVEARDLPVAEQPSAEAPDLPVAEQPPAEALDLPIAEQPPVEAPDLPIAEQPPAEALDLPIAEQPLGEAPSLPVAEQPPVEAHDLPVAEQPPAEAPDLPVAEQPPAEAPDLPVAEQPPAEASDLPVAEQPPAEALDLPVAEQPPPEAADLPSAEEPPAKGRNVPVAESGADARSKDSALTSSLAMPEHAPVLPDRRPAGRGFPPPISGVSKDRPARSPKLEVIFETEPEPGERKHLRAQVERFRAGLEQLTPAHPISEANSQRGQDRSATLIADANDVLLKKIKEAAESTKQAAHLRKELKQRELALVEAWTQRQVADGRIIDLEKRIGLYEQGKAPRSSGPQSLSSVALASGAVLLLTIAVLGLKTRDWSKRAQSAESVVALVRATGPELHEEARQSLAANKLDDARDKVGYALALQPDIAEYHATKGRIHESLLQLAEAQAAYERALALGGSRPDLEASVELCRRLLRTRRPIYTIENLYALHRLMMEQGRLLEALHIAQQIKKDSGLLLQTWTAILVAAGIQGDLSVSDDGLFDLRLRPDSTGNLAALREMPLRSLFAPRSQLADLEPLRGMKLQRLDVSQTSIRDISVLRGMPLQELDLSNTSVTSLSALAGMPLKKLRLDYTTISDISDLSGMPLEELSLGNTRVANIAPLTQSPLRRLNLSHTAVRDLIPLKHLPIEELNLEHSGVVDLTSLAGGSLGSLTLSETRVKDLSPLRGTPIKRLALAGCNELQGLEPLIECRELERLVVPRKGPSAAPLRTLSGLRFLSYDSDSGVAEQTAQQFWAAQPPAPNIAAKPAAPVSARPRSSSRPYSQ